MTQYFKSAKSFKCIVLIVVMGVLFSSFSCYFINHRQFACAQIVDSHLNGLLPLLKPCLEQRSYDLPVIRGIEFDAKNPFHLKFYFDTMDAKNIRSKDMKRLIKYFLGFLAVPEDKLWVNLSPYEKDRIISPEIASLDIGKDFLLADYLLKQLSSSFTDPRSSYGRKFWQQVYKVSYAVARTTKIPVNTFNKIWIVPDKAVVCRYRDMSFVKEAKLKVLMEEDYLALHKNLKDSRVQGKNKEAVEAINRQAKEIFKKDILPLIEEQINSSENFASLRQLYYALVLATYFKKRLKDHVVYRHYINQNKASPIVLENSRAKEIVYNSYLNTFKKGIYNYFKTEYDPYMKLKIKRRYYSGGMDTRDVGQQVVTEDPLNGEMFAAQMEQAVQNKKMNMGDVFIGDNSLGQEENEFNEEWLSYPFRLRYRSLRERRRASHEEEHLQYERILQCQYLGARMRDIFAKKQGDILKEYYIPNIDEIIKVLKEQNPLGNILNEKIGKGDRIVVFLSPGTAKEQNAFGIKDLNDRILGYQLTTDLMKKRKELIIKLMIQNGLIEDRHKGHVYSTYKEDVFVMKNNLSERQLEGKLKDVQRQLLECMSAIIRGDVSAAASLGMTVHEMRRFKDVAVRTISQSRWEDKKNPLCWVDFGVSVVNDNSSQARLSADINAHQAITIARLGLSEAKGHTFNRTNYLRVVNRFIAIRELLSRETKVFVGGNHVLPAAVAEKIRKNVEWEQLDKTYRQKFLLTQDTYALLKEYVRLLNVQDYIKKWEMSFTHALHRQQNVDRAIAALVELTHKVKEHGEVLLGRTEVKLLHKIERYIGKEVKSRSFTSEIAFHSQAPPFVNPVYIMCDIKGMGIMNLNAFEEDLLKIQEAILRGDEAEIHRLWRSAADDVTRETFKKFCSIQKLLKQQIGPEAGGKILTLLGGDEFTIVVDDNRGVVSSQFLQRIRRETGTRVCATKGIPQFRHDFRGRSDFDPRCLAHAKAVVSLDEGIGILKDLEAKGIHDAVAMQDEYGQWMEYVDEKQITRKLVHAQKTKSSAHIVQLVTHPFSLPEKNCVIQKNEQGWSIDAEGFRGDAQKIKNLVVETVESVEQEAKMDSTVTKIVLTSSGPLSWLGVEQTDDGREIKVLCLHEILFQGGRSRERILKWAVRHELFHLKRIMAGEESKMSLNDRKKINMDEALVIVEGILDDAKNKRIKNTINDLMNFRSSVKKLYRNNKELLNSTNGYIHLYRILKKNKSINRDVVDVLAKDILHQDQSFAGDLFTAINFIFAERLVNISFDENAHGFHRLSGKKRKIDSREDAMGEHQGGEIQRDFDVREMNAVLSRAKAVAHQKQIKATVLYELAQRLNRNPFAFYAKLKNRMYKYNANDRALAMVVIRSIGKSALSDVFKKNLKDAVEFLLTAEIQQWSNEGGIKAVQDFEKYFLGKGLKAAKQNGNPKGKNVIGLIDEFFRKDSALASPALLAEAIVHEALEAVTGGSEHESLYQGIQRLLFGENILKKELRKYINNTVRSYRAGKAFERFKRQGQDYSLVCNQGNAQAFLQEFVGMQGLALKGNVYDPSRDIGHSFQFARMLRKQMGQYVSGRGKKSREKLNILVIGSGSGFDTMVAYDQARFEHGFKNVAVDAIDIDSDALETTRFNCSLMFDCEQDLLESKGIRTRKLDLSGTLSDDDRKWLKKDYDLILFNAPDADRGGDDKTTHIPLDVFVSILSEAGNVLSADGIMLIANQLPVLQNSNIKNMERTLVDLHTGDDSLVIAGAQNRWFARFCFDDEEKDRRARDLEIGRNAGLDESKEAAENVVSDVTRAKDVSLKRVTNELVIQGVASVHDSAGLSKKVQGGIDFSPVAMRMEEIENDDFSWNEETCLTPQINTFLSQLQKFTGFDFHIRKVKKISVRDLVRNLL